VLVDMQLPFLLHLHTCYLLEQPRVIRIKYLLLAGAEGR
jgi:hypothetical protein